MFFFCPTVVAFELMQMMAGFVVQVGWSGSHQKESVLCYVQLPQKQIWLTDRYIIHYQNRTAGRYILHAFPLGVEPVSGITNAMPDLYK